MTRIHRITLSSLAAVWSTCSYATFHFWEITEVYSNADGSIQFIELFTGQPGQEFVAGQTLTASDASGETRTFRFPRNLPAPTTGRHFLLATPAFASVSGGVVPDFEIPAGFTGGRPRGSIWPRCRHAGLHWCGLAVRMSGVTCSISIHTTSTRSPKFN